MRTLAILTHVPAWGHLPRAGSCFPVGSGLPCRLLDIIVLLAWSQRHAACESSSLFRCLITMPWVISKYFFRSFWSAGTSSCMAERPPLPLVSFLPGALCQPQGPRPAFCLLIGLMQAGDKLFSLKAPDRALGRNSVTSEGLCLHRSTIMVGCWLWNQCMLSPCYVPGMVERIIRMSSPKHPTPPWGWGQCPHFTDEESQSQEKWIGLRSDELAGGKARIRTQLCWLPHLTLSTHALAQLSMPGPSLPKRRPLWCFVSLKANQKNSLQLAAGISSIGLWVFLVRMHPGAYHP